MSNAFALQLPKFDPEPGSVVGDVGQSFDTALDDLGPLPELTGLDSDLPELRTELSTGNLSLRH